MHVDAELLHNSYLMDKKNWNVFVPLCIHVLLYDIGNVYVVTRSLCLCVFSPGCRSLGHPGCRCFSGSLPRSASCFMRSYCISHRVTYLLFLSHTLIHAHTHTHPPFLLGLAVTVSTGQVLTTPPNSSFASSFFFFHFELHVAVAFFFL